MSMVDHAQAQAQAIQEQQQNQSCGTTQQQNSLVGFRDFEEVLFEGELETLPFEFGCDFSHFEEKQVVERTIQRDTTSSSKTSVTLIEAQDKNESTTNDYSKKKQDQVVVVPSENQQVDQEEKKTKKQKPKQESYYTELLQQEEEEEQEEDDDDDEEEEDMEEEKESQKSQELIEEKEETIGTKPSSLAQKSSSSSQTQIGRWTKREHELFLEGLKLYGKSWKKISNLVVTRTLVQIRTHAQKYLQKQSKHQKTMLAAAQATAVQNQNAAMKYHQQLQHQHHQHHHHHHHQQQQQQHHRHHQQQQRLATATMMGGFIAGTNPYFTPDAFHAHTQLQAPMYHHPIPTEAQEAIPSKLDQLLHEDSDFFSPTGTDDDIYTPNFPMGMENHFSVMDHLKRSQDAMKIMSQLKPIAPSHPTAVASVKRRRLEPMMVPQVQQQHQQQEQQLHHILSAAMVDPMMNGGYGMYMNMNPTMIPTNDLQFASTTSGPYDIMNGHQFPNDAYRWMP
jgi:SHAQKYF class myb-like DNA-binding protein